MEKHTLIRNLPSCNIEKPSLVLIEGCLLDKFKDYANHNEFKFIIKDRFGQTELDSVKDFKLSYFSDDANKLNIIFSNNISPIFNISIIFSRSRSRSEIKIELESNNAREQANVIYSNIIEILKPHKNINFIFYLHQVNEILDIILSIYTFISLGFIPVGLMLMFTSPSNAISKELLGTSSVIFVILGLATPFYIISSRLKPYCVFHTRRNLNFSRAYNWIWKVILGSIIGRSFWFLWNILKN